MKTQILQLSSKQLQKKSGIYAIYCNGKTYIGSSKNLYHRLREHKYKLVNNNHSNDYLQKASNKYGISKVEYEILEFCPSEQRITKEKYYIDTLKPEFNLQLDPVLRTLSIHSKQKLSKSIIKGRKEGKYKTKYDYCSIEQYDYFGNYITSYLNKDLASKHLGVSKKIIQRLTSGYTKGLCRKGIRLRYSNSKTKVLKFKVNPNYLGKHFDFYSESENKEQFAFNSVKNVWKYFSKEISSGKTEFKIKIKLKTN